MLSTHNNIDTESIDVIVREFLIIWLWCQGPEDHSPIGGSCLHNLTIDRLVCGSGGSRQVSIVSVETPFWQT